MKMGRKQEEKGEDREDAVDYGNSREGVGVWSEEDRRQMMRYH